MRLGLLVILVAICVTPLNVTADPLRVAVSIAPQAGLIERLAGDAVAVTVMVGPGHSPVTYEPSPRQLATLAHTRLFVRIGVPFEESFMDRLGQTYPQMLIVDQRAGIRLRVLAGHDHAGSHDHQHAHHHDHRAEVADHHIWLDPKGLSTQAATLAAALIAVEPRLADTVLENLAALGADLAALDGRIGGILGPHKGRPVFVFHPAFGYFCESYGLEQVAVETGGKEPSARRLAALIEQARGAGAKVLFVQPQFSDKSARLVAQAIGGAVVPMDPLARDVLANLEDMARKVERALAAN